jgi:hypothetical protein
VKKAIITFALLVAIAAPAAAQEGAGFGAKVGINFANLNFDPEDDEFDPSVRTALTAGVLAKVPVTPRFSFQPEVLFSAQGSKVSEGEFDATIKLNYINVPLLANIALSGGENPVSLLVGPQIGFLTSAKIEGEGEEEDLKDETESTDFGIVAGIAVQIRKFVIDARYTHGLRNINSIDDDDEKVKNRVFTVSFGIMFR